MNDIFQRKTAFKPFTYPHLTAYKDSINHSYWLVSEWNFVSDIQDFHTQLSKKEQTIIKNTLLAISQIEVSVKKFWGNIGNRFPKPEIEQVGITFAECYIDGTEVLTPNGWVDFNKVKVGDPVIQFHEDNTLSITVVRAIVEKPFVGQLHRFHKRTTETLVTPNHRMLVYNNGKMVESLAKDLSLSNSNLKLPEAARIVGGTIEKLSPEERLWLALQADGSCRYCGSGNLRQGNGYGAEYDLSVSRPRKIKRLDWILSFMPKDSYSRNLVPSRPGMVRYTIRTSDAWDFKTFDWVNLNGKSAEWCRDFVEELSEWDGTKTGKKDCKITYGTSVKTNADKAQMVGVAAGYRTTLGTYSDDRKESYQDRHIVSFTENRERTTLPPLKRDLVDYEGIVRCVSVDSGAIVTRYNNKTFIAGNCEVRHSDAYSHLLQVLGLNEDFDLLLENPVIQGRVDYLTKYLKGASDTNNQNYTLTLTLFSMFIENVSLFSQFAIIKAFNKNRNLLKDIDNVIQATQQEENIHAMFGAELIKIIKEENPEWFDEDFYGKVVRAAKKAYEAEAKIIDWVFEDGELDFLPKETLKEFIKGRFNTSLIMIGAPAAFEVDKEKIKTLQWFDEEIYTDTHADFFSKKPVTYSKMMQSISAEDLF